LTSYQYYIQQTRELPLDADTYLDEVLKEHRQILEAFQFKNIETGVSAMTRHLENARKRANLKPV
jgi:DNA-binding FadR family transcriptional regulator